MRKAIGIISAILIISVFISAPLYAAWQKKPEPASISSEPAPVAAQPSVSPYQQINVYYSEGKLDKAEEMLLGILKGEEDASLKDWAGIST